MVLSFFRGGDDPLEAVDLEITTMLGDCRHSFDLGVSTLMSGGDDIDPVGVEIRSTDARINAAEETVRRDLIVHSAVHGGGDAASVMSSVLAVKKLERVGDQAKNIFDLAAEGVRFGGAPDADELRELANEVSNRLGEAVALVSPDVPDNDVQTFVRRCTERMDDLDRRVNQLIHSDEVARRAVPRAMFFRYLKRILANVAGAVEVLLQPVEPATDRDE